MKKIVMLVGSARKGGNTERLADAFYQGAKSAGNEINKITLYNKHIKPCVDCKFCYSHEGQCVYKDDMTEVYEALMRADVLVLASPIYFYNFTAQLKAVIDRLHNPIRDAFKVKETVLLSVCADKGMEVFRPMIDTYKAIGSYLKWRDIGQICVDEVEAKGVIEGHKALEMAEALGRGIL